MTVFNARLGWWMENPRPSALDGRRARRPARPLLRRAARPDRRAARVRPPLRRRPLREPGRLRADPPPLPLHRRRATPAQDADAVLRGPRQPDPAVPDRLRRPDRDRHRRPSGRGRAERLSRWHCAVGKIRYDDVDGGELPGVLVYLKTSLTGDEPPDVQKYARQAPGLPPPVDGRPVLRRGPVRELPRPGVPHRPELFGAFGLTSEYSTTLSTKSRATWRCTREQPPPVRGRPAVLVPAAASAIVRRVCPTAQQAIHLEATSSNRPNVSGIHLRHLPELAIPAAGASTSPARTYAVNGCSRSSRMAGSALFSEADILRPPLNRGWLDVFRRWTETECLPPLLALPPGGV